jgi:hypothetical protein
MKCPLLLSDIGQNFIASPDVSKISQHSDSLILIQSDIAEVHFRNFELLEATEIGFVKFKAFECQGVGSLTCPWVHTDEITAPIEESAVLFYPSTVCTSEHNVFVSHHAERRQFLGSIDSGRNIH